MRARLRLFALAVALVASGCAAPEPPQGAPSPSAATAPTSAPALSPDDAAPAPTDAPPAPPGAPLSPSPTATTPGAPPAAIPEAESPPTPTPAQDAPPAGTTPAPTPAQAAAPPPAATTPAQGVLAFALRVPSDTPATDRVSLLANPFLGPTMEVPMQRAADGTWRASVGAPQGTLFQYRYSRNGDWEKEESWLPTDGQGFPHREVVVTSATLPVFETVAKWEDLPLASSVATVRGVVTDAATGTPVADAVVSGGPYQTRTLSDGSYHLLGVPVGPAHLTFRTDDGSHAPASLGVDVTGDLTRDVALRPAPLRTLVLRVTLPADTPAAAVPRLLGDTAALGLFVDGDGSAFPTTTSLPFRRDGAGWSLPLRLGEGHAFRYVVTLGDHRTNVERDFRGQPQVRALAVAEDGALAHAVGTWQAPGAIALRFDVTAPTDDAVSLATTEWDGAELLPMWPGPQPRAWTYTRYASAWEDLRYRYVRAGDSGIGVEKLSPDASDAWRTPTSASMTDTIASWRHQLREPTATYAGPTPAPRAGFDAGIELIDYWRPAWAPAVDARIARIAATGADTVQVARTWRIGNVAGSAPFIDDGGMNGMPPGQVLAHADAARANGLSFALRSMPYPRTAADEAAMGDAHDAAWLDAFFANMRRAMVEDARLATRAGAARLILANPDLGPAMADPALGARIDAHWRTLLAAVRAEYAGPITTDNFADRAPLTWYSQLDHVGAKFWEPVATGPSDTEAAMQARAASVLERTYRPISERFGKPVFFAEVAFASADGGASQAYGVYARELSDFEPEVESVPSDHAEQAAAMAATLRAMAAAPWVEGAHVFGTSYIEHDSKGFSITGKLAESAVASVYAGLG